MDWERKYRYREVFEYYRGLIALRKAHPAFRMGTADEIRHHLRFLPTAPGLVAYMLRDHANGDPWETIVVIVQCRLPGEKGVSTGPRLGCCSRWAQGRQ